MRPLLAAQILNAFTKDGDLVDALREPPRVEPKYTGQPGDIVAQAELLFRQRRDLTIADLLAFHQRQGGTLDRPAALEALFKNNWSLDGEAWDHLLPEDAYLTGNELWERHDRAEARASRGDLQARSQQARLLAAIRPAVFDDLTELRPNEGWIPLYRALVAKGLRPVAGSRHYNAGGARRRVALLGDKIRWEAGPAAGPPDWTLLQPAHQPGARAAFDAFERRQRPEAA